MVLSKGVIVNFIPPIRVKGEERGVAELTITVMTMTTAAAAAAAAATTTTTTTTTTIIK